MKAKLAKLGWLIDKEVTADVWKQVVQRKQTESTTTKGSLVCETNPEHEN